MRLFEGTEFDVPPRCDRCGELEADCQCGPMPKSCDPAVPPAKQIARIAVEKRKRGKMMTVVRGLADDPPQLSGLLTELKNKCGSGGTIRDGVVEIQGSHDERIGDVLKELGYRVKR